MIKASMRHYSDDNTHYNNNYKDHCERKAPNQDKANSLQVTIKASYRGICDGIACPIKSNRRFVFNQRGMKNKMPTAEAQHGHRNVFETALFTCNPAILISSNRLQSRCIQMQMFGPGREVVNVREAAAVRFPRAPTIPIRFVFPLSDKRTQVLMSMRPIPGATGAIFTLSVRGSASHALATCPTLAHNTATRLPPKLLLKNVTNYSTLPNRLANRAADSCGP
ncbi:hypothetical protein TcasGA2_TC002975 [Tribolium castaneum]|uniref:Uncharacterized protein n=1 Tax=Tribolium castaneum TaxID=7070 RepID=D6WGN5_TRICA|nr:hypothetical protein TcasGA2_TC002975 [Tribolium castaneum]